MTSFPADGGEDQRIAIGTLERFGLSNYEARVFIALQTLGCGTAKEVHELADVPRSQVYGAADSLEERGLVELQQSTPKRYRPVSLDTAREKLTARLEAETEMTFDYLESVRRETTEEETRDDVWTVRGRRSIDDRVTELATRGTRSIVFGAPGSDFVPERLVGTLETKAESGCDVMVVSDDPAVRAVFEGGQCRVVAPVRGSPTTGRVLVCDDSVVLLTVVTDSEAEGFEQETAIWSAGTALAEVIVRITLGGLDAFLQQ
ncbi:MAG: TrmB family transcriptional regulator [Halobacteriota archaeon]